MSQKSIGLGLTWIEMLGLIQNYKSKIYPKERYGQVSLIYWPTVNRESYEFTAFYLSFTISVGQFNIFRINCWLIFLWFLNKVTFFLHLRNDSRIFSDMSLLLVFVPNGPQIRTFYIFLRTFCHFISLQSKKTLLWYLTFHPKFHVKQKSRS